MEEVERRYEDSAEDAIIYCIVSLSLSLSTELEFVVKYNNGVASVADF